MRISADSKSTDWHPVSIYAKVLVDGVEQRACLFADEESGKVQRFALDHAGKIIDNGGAPLTEFVYGSVRIEIPDEHKHLLTEFPFGPMNTHKVTVGDWEPVRTT